MMNARITLPRIVAPPGRPLRSRVLVVLAVVAAGALAPTARADIAPPPAALSFKATDAIEVGRPVTITITVVNRTAAYLLGTLSLHSSGGLSIIGETDLPGLLVTQGGTRSTTVTIVPHVTGAHLLEATFDSGATARLTLVVGAGPTFGPRGRIQTQSDYLVSIASAVFTDRAGDRLLVFPVRGAPPVARVPAEGLTVRGALDYLDRDGSPQEARRVLAQLWAIKGSTRTRLAQVETGRDGGFALSASALPEGSRPELVFSLTGPRWKIRHGSTDAIYSFSPPIPTAASGDVDLGRVTVPSGHAAARSFLILHTLNRALDLFEDAGVDIGWWRPIGINWPASGDYYAWGEVHLTQAHAWDVTAHELGHALMALGSSAQFGGGSHRIDQCYGQTLAFSEGWATFLAGAVHLDRADADARFEFLVPRRAPIRIEIVPEDVCSGDRNEWRVAAALWDILDTHADGPDRLEVDFARVFRALADGGRIGSIKDYVSALTPLLSPDERASLPGLLLHNTIR